MTILFSFGFCVTKYLPHGSSWFVRLMTSLFCFEFCVTKYLQHGSDCFERLMTSLFRFEFCLTKFLQHGDVYLFSQLKKNHQNIGPMTMFSGLFSTLSMTSITLIQEKNFRTLSVDVTHDLVIYRVFTPRNNCDNNPPVMDVRIWCLHVHLHENSYLHQQKPDYN